jgi:uncharacterized protein (DUF697 family)
LDAVRNKSEDEMVLGHGSGTLARPDLEGGRIGAYTVLGGAASVVPLPWLPDVVLRRIRGAMVHEIAMRHGLSLSTEARKVLSEPSGTDGPRGLLENGVRFAAGQLLSRFGPFGLFPPVRSAVSTFLLGHLFERYLEIARSDRSIRINVEEARRIRRAIEQAIVLAFTADTSQHKDPAPVAAEDLRDQITQIIDGVIMKITSLPIWLTRRVEAAFDESLATMRA